MSRKGITRRDFVAGSTKLAMGAMIIPRDVLGGVGYKPPSATLNIACVGIGGMGFNNMQQVLSENVVAVCDVDFPFVERTLAGKLRPNNQGVVSQDAVRLEAAYRKAAKHADFRRMLEQHPEIDAVMIATPDHTHAVIASMAMKAGKHVYVQKPLTYSVHEARALLKTQQEMRVVGQMGNQGHSMESTRRINEIIQSGVIGPVREVHIWTNRPVNFWAQGIPRPPQPGQQQGGAPATAPTRWNMQGVNGAILRAMAENSTTIPEGLDWDLYLGPAREIPYHPAYHPFTWRGWVDFGVGALGDMGAHLIDQPYWALSLGLPTSVVASSTPWGGPANNPATYPLAVTAQYEFAARGAQPPVKMFWYDSGLLPPRPEMLPDDVPLPSGDGGGGYFVGDKGILTYETYGRNAKVYPEAVAQAAEQVPRTFARVEGSHEMNWVNACKGEVEASSPFEYASPLTEVMLLGMAALRAGQGRKLLYDGANMRFTNHEAANQFLTREYRAGWSL
jgi:predicted dehydrogenase